MIGVDDDRGGSRITSVQVLRIDPDGRVGRDGRLCIGDYITEVDGRPVYQVCTHVFQISYC